MIIRILYNSPSADLFVTCTTAYFPIEDVVLRDNHNKIIFVGHFNRQNVQRKHKISKIIVDVGHLIGHRVQLNSRIDRELTKIRHSVGHDVQQSHHVDGILTDVRHIVGHHVQLNNSKDICLSNAGQHFLNNVQNKSIK